MMGSPTPEAGGPLHQLRRGGEVCGFSAARGKAAGHIAQRRGLGPSRRELPWLAGRARARSVALNRGPPRIGGFLEDGFLETHSRVPPPPKKTHHVFGQTKDSTESKAMVFVRPGQARVSSRSLGLPSVLLQKPSKKVVPHKELAVAHSASSLGS